MFDAANARRLMVEGQIRTADVTDTAVLDAMQALPRERFLPPGLVQLAYLDGDVPVRRGRTLLRPMVLAKLVQAARIDRNDRVLDLGCATGYSAALMSRLAGSVVALDLRPDAGSPAADCPDDLPVDSKVGSEVDSKVGSRARRRVGLRSC
jgi:protein-L-isoaspartate(D-aspartate) O-methyltransferase